MMFVHLTISFLLGFAVGYVVCGLIVVSGDEDK